MQSYKITHATRVDLVKEYPSAPTHIPHIGDHISIESNNYIVLNRVFGDDSITIIVG